MAIADDNDFPRLTPPDDRNPLTDRLLHKPEDLSDDQFDLLAAAWADGALSGDALAEIESVMATKPSRKERAESFRKIKLVPCDERWNGKKDLLIHISAPTVIRRTLIITAAAAAIIAFILLGPFKPDNLVTEPVPLVSAVISAPPEAEIKAASPVVIRPVNEVVTSNHITVKAAVASAPSAEAPLPERAAIIPVNQQSFADIPVLTAATNNINLTEPVIIPAATEPVSEKEMNWIIRGVTMLAGNTTKEGKKRDGFMIARACINGINNFLGWDMELDRKTGTSGEASAVYFNSSLLSFSAPVNKISQ